jgi:hypothetical protein
MVAAIMNAENREPNPLTITGKQILQLRVQLQEELELARRMNIQSDVEAAKEAVQRAGDLQRRIEELKRQKK